MKKLSPIQIENAYRSAIENKQLDISNTAVIFYSKEILKNRLDLLSNNFSSNTLHAIAVKTNSHPEILALIAAEGFGLEAASLEEVILAKEAGVSNEKIVFDSPVKTKAEIDYCHNQIPGIIINANSLQELKRYPIDFSGQLGLRINPLVNADAPDLLNVSKKASKFGVPITKETEIIKACTAYSNITGLHVHIGSGIKNYQANIIAVSKIVQLANKINEARQTQQINSKIEFIDIGGGIQFDDKNDEFSISNFVRQLTDIGLFENFKVVTEYGKFIHKDAAFAVSDIEYILDGENEQDSKTAFIHVGADLFVRKVYSDLPINYPWQIIKSTSANKNKGTFKYNIAGPLCFAGDFLYYNIPITELSEQDKFVITEIGANTLSMWSSHCSRNKPKLIIF